MAKYSYNGKTYPKLPDWTKDYEYITLHDPNLGDTYIIAANDYKIVGSSNITYGTTYTTYPVNGVASVYANGEWGEPISTSEAPNSFFYTRSPYADASYNASWANKDIPCKHSNGTEYIARAGSAPVLIEGIDSIAIYAVDSTIKDFVIGVSVEVVGKDVDLTATCTVSGNSSANTKLAASQYTNHWSLYVAEDETAETLTITATSVSDPSITATKTITIKGNSSGEGGDSGGEDPGGDSGGGEGGDDGWDDGGGGGGYTEADPEKLKEVFWKGFSACAALYGMK